MRIRFAGREVLRRLLPLALLACVLVVAAPGFGQTPAPSATSIVQNAKTALDEVEAALARGDVSVEQLDTLRGALSGARDALRTQLGELEPRLAEADARLKQLGPPPAKDAPPEPPQLAAEREQTQQAFAALDGTVKQNRLLQVRGDQLADRIVSHRHDLYARQILERSPSAFDPSFWREVGVAASEESKRVAAILYDWAETVARTGPLRLVAALLCLGGLFLAAIWLRGWWRRRYAGGAPAETRLAKARLGLWVFLSITVVMPAVTTVVFQVLVGFRLWVWQLDEIAIGIVAAVAAAAFGRGAARGLFAPERPERRMIAVSDGAAQCLADHIIWSTRVLGLAIILQVTHKAIVSPLVLTIATNVLFAVAIATLLIHLIICLRRAESAPVGAGVPPAPAVPWVRLLGWLTTASIAVTLVAGYAGLAAFIALRMVVAVTLGCALYLWLAAADALFSEALGADTPRGKAVAASLGITPRSASLVCTLLSAVIRIALTILVLMLILGPWEASTANLFEAVPSVSLGWRIGEISISFRGFVNGLVALMVVLLATRVVQNWLQTRFLPLTTLEPSLQLSIATIFGYVGAITAIALALGALGIDLQKIALVAGALSVGIGFGLQSIVSNFVSGLILLAERPIRVGDSIVVKGEEGWVRRIRVRATEIETYERASVIIPNSELITGMVKNWTHANTMGRVIIKVGVGYASDVDKVRDLLEGIANKHPQVVRSPAPRAFLLGFGDSSLDFELRCVVSNFDYGLGVRSDLHFAILKAFREHGIEIPYPQRELRMRTGDGNPHEGSSQPVPSAGAS